MRWERGGVGRRGETERGERGEEGEEVGGRRMIEERGQQKIILRTANNSSDGGQRGLSG